MEKQIYMTPQTEVLEMEVLPLLVSSDPVDDTNGTTFDDWGNETVGG